MTRVRRIDHVAIVVKDLDQALAFWKDQLGLQLDHMEEVHDQQSVVAFLPAGDSEVELVRPTSDDSGIARFLRKRGPGIHHICFEIEDIEEALADLKRRGVQLINERPMIGTGGKLIAFIHPESTGGVLVELYELSGKERDIRFERARELADQVVASGQYFAAGVMAFVRSLRDENNWLRRSAPAEDQDRANGT
jgi:methylmalonyl-CoA/ethylmalonyl-CoA epimerase